MEEGIKRCVLYKGACGRHRIRVIKRSEATKGSIGLIDLHVRGQIFTSFASEKRRKLEFIGDSITCGFGIETDERGNFFHTSLENGLGTYAEVCSEILDADYQSICISGIPLCSSYREDFRMTIPEFPEFEVPERAMEICYPYTDFYFQKKQDVAVSPEKWDFQRFIPDAIVVNLGTNDAFRIKASDFDVKEEEYFEERYMSFLKLLRKCNGNYPVIMCTLGPMDYYLYDNILRAVESYKAKYGDKNVHCMKFGGIYMQKEGIGALDHPGIQTHQRMGKELADALRVYLQ